MRKHVLVLLTFVPIIVGYVVNLSLSLPVLGMVFFYLLPLFTTAFWFYLGRQYARSTWKTIPAILIGNATGIISLLIFLWQFLLETDETRNLTLAATSQMFSASAPAYLFVRVAILFEKQPNYAGITTMVALQVISVVYMIAVFCLAIFWEKRRLKNVTGK